MGANLVLHHLIKSDDITFLGKCIYCGTALEERSSEFLGKLHYKTTQCSNKKCGKIHRHAVDFLGSGNDSWNNQMKQMMKKYCS